MIDFDQIEAYERDEMTDQEVITLFQQLIDDGDAWRLQGSYGRKAAELIEAGYCMLGETSHRDYWGHYVPSRYEVAPGQKGSEAYCLQRRSKRTAETTEPRLASFSLLREAVDKQLTKPTDANTSDAGDDR